MNSNKRAKLLRLMSPRNIAFIGGSEVEIALREARRRKFRGELWPVNPKRKEILGIKCFKTVEELPRAPDASFIAVPAQLVPSIVKKLARIQAGGIVCYSAGFGETGMAGQVLERELIENAGDLPIIGPNCYGFINYLENVALWPFAHGGWSPGFGAAIITQSGMLSSDITMTQRSLPLTHMISVGNQSSVTIEDFLELLCENSKVKAIGVHIEGIKDIEKFHCAALECLKRGVPIVVLKTGSSQIGSALAATHTGSLSGEDNLYTALFERTGIIRVANPNQFLETIKFLCISGVPKDDSLVAFTCSGGGAALIADHSEKIKIHLPVYDQHAKKQIADLLPSIANVSNPLDYTTPIWGIPKKTYPVYKKAIQCSNAATALLLQDYPAAGLDESEIFYLNDAKAFIKSVKELKIPAAICSTFTENIGIKTRELLISLGVSPLQGIEEALNAIKHASNYAQKRQTMKDTILRDLHKIPKNGSSEFLTEAESKTLLNKIGIETPKGFCLSQKYILNNRIELKFPVALKLLSRTVLHKTDFGAVKINIKTNSELKSLSKKMHNSLKFLMQDETSNSFLVEQMQEPPIVEMLVGIKSDHQFGCFLVLGSGGCEAEVLKDTMTLLLPVTKTEIRDAIKSLRMYSLMNGFRGKAKVNLKYLVNKILKITTFFENNTDKYSSLEVNPLFVYQNSVCAVDALISCRADVEH